MKPKIYKIKHAKISLNLLKQIIFLKKQEWNYSFKSHLSWIHSNLKKNDIHILLKFKNKIIGYTMLRNKILSFDKRLRNVLYFDTHIIRKNYRGKKYKNIKFSDLLMREVLIEVKKLERISILRCRKIYERYYAKSNWVKYSKIKFNDKKKLITMVFSNKRFKMKRNAIISL